MDKRTFFAGMGAGAAAMFFLEPSARRRRAWLRNKGVHVLKKSARFSARSSRDLANRTKGTVMELSGRLWEGQPSGEVLAERVRSKMGRVISDPGAIQVLVADRRVTLRGPILQSELDDLLHEVAGVRGVRGVVNELDVHESRGNVPALQGRRHWPLLGRMSHAARLVTGIAAGTAAVMAMSRRVA